MFGRGSKRLIRTIAMLCVAMTCVFSMQTIVIALDRLEHALEIEHDGNPVAGTVQYCVAAADACEQSDGAINPISHAHSGDTVTNIMLGSARSLVAIDFKATTIPLAGPQAGPSISQVAPDRPPKA